MLFFSSKNLCLHILHPKILEKNDDSYSLAQYLREEDDLDLYIYGNTIKSHSAYEHRFASGSKKTF